MPCIAESWIAPGYFMMTLGLIVLVGGLRLAFVFRSSFEHQRGSRWLVMTIVGALFAVTGGYIAYQWNYCLTFQVR